MNFLQELKAQVEKDKQRQYAKDCKFAAFVDYVTSHERVTPFFNTVQEVESFIKEYAIGYDVIRPVINWKQLEGRA